MIVWNAANALLAPQLLLWLPMDPLNPYQSSAIEADVVDACEADRPPAVPWLSRAIGVFACIWGAAAWVEWFVVPMFTRTQGGPVPHLAFAPQAIALFLGCIVLSAISVMHAMLENRISRLLFAIPAASYVLYQIWRIW